MERGSLYVQIIKLKIPSVDTHVNALHTGYISRSLVGASCSAEQLVTHQDRNKSVAVSTVVNKANTIQYIIHFTWTHTHTAERPDHKNRNANTPERPAGTCWDTWGRSRQTCHICCGAAECKSACMNDQLETKEM